MLNITNISSLAAVTTAAATTLLTTLPNASNNNNNNNNNINNNISNNGNNNISNDENCPEIEKYRYQSVIGIELAVPQWEAILVTIILTFIILLTIIGNTLVILSVFTYKPLRIVQNFFIVSLAVADLTVAILVLPFNVIYIILGRWVFGIHLCKMWLTSDVLCCTSSILNLCAIALDRFWAITDPINYAQKRTLERVLYLIAGVWILSLIISSPPLIGWNDWPEIFESDTPCTLNSNPGYRIYSALGSFFIPLVIMTIVYIEIFVATRRRLRERARATRLNATNNIQNNNNNNISINNNSNNNNNKNKNNKNNKTKKIILTSGKDTGGTQQDQESISSETNHNEHQHCNLSENLPNEKHHIDNNNKTRKKDLRKKAKDSIKTNKKYNENLLQAIVAEDSITDIPIDDDAADNLLNSKYNNGNNECINVIIIDGNKTTINLNDDIKYIDSSGLGGVSDDIGITTVGITTTTPTSTTTTPTTTTSTTTPKFTKIGDGTGTATANVMKKSSNVYQFIEEKQKISLSKERRAARTLGIIMGVFILCWVPFFLLYIIVPFCPTCCPSDRLIDFLTWLGYINSALNPIIYTIFNLEYRRAFKKLLGIKF